MDKGFAPDAWEVNYPEKLLRKTKFCPMCGSDWVHVVAGDFEGYVECYKCDDWSVDMGRKDYIDKLRRKQK